MRHLVFLTLLWCCASFSLHAEDALPPEVQSLLRGELFAATAPSGEPVAVELNSKADENFQIEWEKPDRKSPGWASCVSYPDDPEKKVEYRVLFSSVKAGSKVVAVFATSRLFFEIPNSYDHVVGCVFQGDSNDRWPYKLYATGHPDCYLANNAAEGLLPMLIRVPPGTPPSAFFKTGADSWLRLYLGNSEQERLAAFRPDFNRLVDDLLAPKDPENAARRRAYGWYGMATSLVAPDSPLVTKELCSVLLAASEKLRPRFGAPGPFQKLIWSGFLQDVQESAAHPEEHPLTLDDVYRAWDLGEKLAVKPDAGAFEKRAHAALASLPSDAFRVRRSPDLDTEPVSEAERQLLAARSLDVSSDASSAYAAVKQLLDGKMADMNEALAEAVVRCPAARLTDDSDERLRDDLVSMTPGWVKDGERATYNQRVNARDRVGLRILLALLAEVRASDSPSARESLKEFLATPKTFFELPLDGALTALFAENTKNQAEQKFWFNCEKLPRDPEELVRVVDASRSFSELKDPSELMLHLSGALGRAKDPSRVFSSYQSQTGRPCLRDLIEADRQFEEGRVTSGLVDKIASVLLFLKLTERDDAPRYAASLLAAHTAPLLVLARMHTSGSHPDLLGKTWERPLLRQLEERADAVYEKKHYALAAGLYLYAHLIEHPEMKSFPGITAGELLAGDDWSFLAKARRSAVRASWPAFWLPLGPHSVETPYVTHTYNSDPVLCRAPITSVLGVTLGEPEAFAQGVNTFISKGKARIYSITGSPATWEEGDNLPAATWVIPETPEALRLTAAIAEKRDEIQRSEATYQRLREFYALDKEPPYRDVGSSSVDSSGLEGAQATLEATRQRYAEDLNRGIYVGADPNRYDRVITREMTSVERRSAETLIDGLEKQAEMERQFYQQRLERARAEEEAYNAEVRQRQEYERNVDAPGHRRDMAARYESLHALERARSAARQPGRLSSDFWMTPAQVSRGVALRISLKEKLDDMLKRLASGAEKDPDISLNVAWMRWWFGCPSTDTEKMPENTFHGTRDKWASGAYAGCEAPLSAFSDQLLEALKSPADRTWNPGLAPVLLPNLRATPEWASRQASAILDDAWLRYSTEPYELRSAVYTVAWALKRHLGDPSAASAALRPWVQRYMKAASSQDVLTVFLWDQQLELRQVILAAMQQ